MHGEKFINDICSYVVIVNTDFPQSLKVDCSYENFPQLKWCIFKVCTTPLHFSKDLH